MAPILYRVLFCHLQHTPANLHASQTRSSIYGRSGCTSGQQSSADDARGSSWRSRDIRSKHRTLQTVDTLADLQGNARRHVDSLVWPKFHLARHHVTGHKGKSPRDVTCRACRTARRHARQSLHARHDARNTHDTSRHDTHDASCVSCRDVS